MNFWYIIKNNAGIFSVFLILVVISWSLFITTLKKRSIMNKTTSITILFICILVMFSSILMLIFIFYYKYNSLNTFVNH